MERGLHDEMVSFAKFSLHATDPLSLAPSSSSSSAAFDCSSPSSILLARPNFLLTLDGVDLRAR